MWSSSISDLKLRMLDGRECVFSDFAGQVLLIVNVASRCGFTPQYSGLQELFSRYHDQGFHILAFPCNQFGGQEPGSSEEILNFCSERFQVTFPLFEKIDVNGSSAHPLFVALKKAAPGALGTEAIKWNFTKFLIGRDGNVLGRYSSMTRPEELVPAIELALAAGAP